MSAPRLLIPYPPELTGYELAVQAMRKVGVSLSDCQHEPYFLGSVWWWIVTPDGQAFWLSSKSGKLLEASGDKRGKKQNARQAMYG